MNTKKLLCSITFCGLNNFQCHKKFSCACGKYGKHCSWQIRGLWKSLHLCFSYAWVSSLSSRLVFSFTCRKHKLPIDRFFFLSLAYCWHMETCRGRQMRKKKTGNDLTNTSPLSDCSHFPVAETEWVMPSAAFQSAPLFLPWIHTSFCTHWAHYIVDSCFSALDSLLRGHSFPKSKDTGVMNAFFFAALRMNFQPRRKN